LKVAVSGIDMEEDKKRLFAEIRVLQALHHRSIMSFHNWWYNEKRMTINFITEVGTADSTKCTG
jgi:hypothetical protein